MPLRLSNKDVAALNVAMTVLLTPFSCETGDEWRRTVCKAFEAPLRATGSSFALPLPEEPLIGGASDIVSALQALIPPPDWLVHGLMVKRRALGLSVFDWEEIHDVPAVKQTAFYNDVVVPNRFLAPVAITADIASSELPAVLAFYTEDERTARGLVEKRKQMLQLMVPAFRAGVAAYIGLARQRRALMSFIDAAPTGLLLLNTEGGVLHENNSAGRLFGADPERQRLRAEVKRIAVRVACLVTCPGKLDWMNRPVLADVRTAVGRYRITATFLEEGWFGSSATVVALVDRIAARPLDAHQLASQFRLTGREIEAAQLLKRGYSSRQIAATLGISVNTARRHTEHVLSKLDVHSRAAVISRLDGN